MASKRPWNDVLLLNSKTSSLSRKSVIKASVPTHAFELKYHGML